MHSLLKARLFLAASADEKCWPVQERQYIFTEASASFRRNSGIIDAAEIDKLVST